jgi:glycosyltransferase involved in cell wall biosynthesis
MTAESVGPLKIVHIQRLPAVGRFSIEGYFSRVRECLSKSVGVELFVLPHLSQGFFKRLANTAAAFRHQGDVTHVTGDINYVTIVLNRRRTVLTILDCEVLHRSTGVKKAILKMFWYSWPARRAAATTVISEETKRQLLQQIQIPEERIHVIPVSVSPSLRPMPSVFNDNCPNILQIGTKDNKNVVRLAEALHGISCHLDIVGPLTPPIRSALSKNKIRFTNHLQLSDEQILERYIAADIVSFVSTYEGFGMPIIEAQNVERVCVTSNCSSMPEVAGPGACLVDPFDVTSIREGFLHVIGDADYRNSVIAAGRINRLRFEPQKIADQFLELYKAVYANSST